MTPTAVLTATPEAGSVPLHVQLDGAGSADPDGSLQGFRWSFDDGSPDGAGTLVSHTFQLPGTYRVQLTVTDDHGATSTGSVDVRVIDGQPPVAVAVATPETGGAPLSVQFDSAGSSDPDGIITLFEWNFGDGSTVSQGQNPTHVFQQPGNYDVTLTVADDDGLSDVETLTIMVDPPANVLPEPSFTATPQAGAAPLLSQFDASGSSDPDGQIADYQWDFGDGGSASGIATSHTFNSPGVYDVTLIVTDNESGVASTTLPVAAGAPPTARISASPDSGTPSLAVEFDASGSSDSDGTVVGYQWDFDDGASSAAASPTHAFEDPGEYQVSLVVVDDDGLPSPPATATISVSADPDSLSFRDFFNTNTLSEYQIVAGSGQSVSYDGGNDRMRVIAANAGVEVAHNLPAEDEGFFQIRFLPSQANSAAASFSLYLEENDTTYYLLQAFDTVGSGEPSGVIRKFVNGTMVAETFYPEKLMQGSPTGYTNGLAYSINVYFSPDRFTAEFTELRPRVISFATPGGTPIKVGRMRVVMNEQDGYLDGIIKEPIEPDKLNYYVAFGDSITEGTGDGVMGDGHGFPIELQRVLLDNLVTTQVVFNEGFGGLKTQEATSLVSEVLQRHPRAQYVAVMIGTNDALQGTINEGQYGTYVDSILDSIRSAGKQPFIARLPHATSSANARIDAYNQAIDDLLKEPANSDIYVIPPDFQCYFDANPELINPDHIHPTGVGYKAMAQLWYQLIDQGASAPPGAACTIE